MPLLWLFTGGVLAGNVQSAVGFIPSGRAPGAGLAQSLLHGGFFLLLLVGWARYLDRRPLSQYGVSVRSGWVLDALVGFVAVLLGFALWIGFGTLLGGRTVTVSPSLPDGSLLFGLGLPFVTLVLHAAVQQVVFFRVVLGTAAEGLHSRGASAVQAAGAAVPVAVLLFVAMHGEMGLLRAIDLVVAGSVFALLYLHTGELALGIGAHFGSLYAGFVLSALVQTSGSLPGVLGVLGQYGFPKVLVAYLVIVVWLRWRQDTVGVRTAVVRWTGH